MFKNHPKGLLPAALANMGERFGFYTMMAILTLFLMSKFGLDKTNAGIIYSVFYFSIYILAFVGGLIADRLGRIPENGEPATVQWGGLSFTCLEVRDRRIQRVRCTRLEESDAQSEEKER